MTAQVEQFLDGLYDSYRKVTGWSTRPSWCFPQAKQLYADYLSEREKEMRQ